MTRWEYMKCNVYSTAHLNYLGHEGWEGFAVADGQVLLKRECKTPTRRPEGYKVIV